MAYSYKAREGTPIKDLEGLRKFLDKWSTKKHGEIHSAEVFYACGPMKHPSSLQRVPQYMIEIKTENKKEFKFVPAELIEKLI